MNGPISIHIQVTNIQGMILVPLLLREQVFGFLGLEMLEHDRAITSEESNLLGIFSLDIAQLIEDSRLFEQSKALITAEERNRLARDLHDSVTQTLFTASLLSEAVPRMFDKDQAIARQYMTELNMLIRGALAEMRSMLIELRSGELQNQTLDELLVTLVEAARARTNGTIGLSAMPVSGLPKDVTVTLYRIAREALNNAIIHAEATEIHVSLLTDSGEVEIHIRDNGCGFDSSDLPVDHFGIRIMGERAEGIGSDVQIHSQPGQGTDIVITWPDSEGG
jgi:two-component system nitrate/nitrite sensor histidine kinase NarX